MPELAREREGVLPSHLREKWSLRKFGEVFDVISASPSREAGEPLFQDELEVIENDEKQENDRALSNKWRTKLPKRLLLATLDDDSTIVYYIIHDGIVKPRQN